MSDVNNYATVHKSDFVPEVAYAIGDLHGNFNALREALSVIEKHADGRQARFICCGDFVDRGPNARGIIDLFMQGPSLPNFEWIILKGNHEDIFLAGYLQPELHFTWWMQNGGYSTLESYGYKQGDHLGLNKVPREHLEWLIDLPHIFDDGQRVYIHAGIDQQRPVDKQSAQYVTWHYDKSEQDYAFEGKHVVCGHIQHADGPFMTANRTNVDTFAWLYGRQGIAVFDDTKAAPVEILWAEVAPDPRLEQLEAD